MKVITNNQIALISGGTNNPGHNDLSLAFSEGALNGLVALAPVTLMGYELGLPLPTLALTAGATFCWGIMGELARAYYDVPATYIYY